MDDPLLTLKGRVQTADSMTEILRQWCDTHGIGHGPLRSEHAPASGELPPSPRAIDALQLRSEESTRHRGIVLMRGDVGLLEADNWYVPGRLPAEVNKVLETTDTPFGAALPGDGQTRKTLYCDTDPLPSDTAALSDSARKFGPPILTVRAIVVLGEMPVAFVEERLRPQLIGNLTGAS